MSSELHIVRTPESPDNIISSEEWLGAIQSDPELSRKESADIPQNWISATVSGAEDWETLYWRNGSISAKYPQSKMTSKMLDLSEHFSAALMTDEGIILKRGANGHIEVDGEY